MRPTTPASRATDRSTLTLDPTGHRRNRGRTPTEPPGRRGDPDTDSNNEVTQDGLAGTRRQAAQHDLGRTRGNASPSQPSQTRWTGGQQPPPNHVRQAGTEYPAPIRPQDTGSRPHRHGPPTPPAQPAPTQPPSPTTHTPHTPRHQTHNHRPQQTKQQQEPHP